MDRTASSRSGRRSPSPRESKRTGSAAGSRETRTTARSRAAPRAPQATMAVGAPVVSETDRSQVKRQFDRVVDVDAHPERVRQHLVPPLETQRLNAERRGEEVRDDGHGAAARSCARRPENQTRASPPPIQARSRSRLTMAVYTPRAGSSPSSWNTR